MSITPVSWSTDNGMVGVNTVRRGDTSVIVALSARRPCGITLIGGAREQVLARGAQVQGGRQSRCHPVRSNVR